LNCSRMNVACQSSFHTNFRIRISTPTGQADLENNAKSPTENTGHADNPLPHPPPAASTPRSVGDLEGTLCPPCVSQEQLPRYSTEFYPDIQMATTPSVCRLGAHDSDNFVFPATWEFGSPSPSGPIFHTPPFVSGAQATEHLVNSPACFDSSAAAGIPDVQHVLPFSYEVDSCLHGQFQDGMGTDWWAGGQQRW
jgi:hypothetical protein